MVKVQMSVTTENRNLQWIVQPEKTESNCEKLTQYTMLSVFGNSETVKVCLQEQEETLRESIVA